MKEGKYPELLAPAGSFQTLEAVVQAGADAVYLGGSRFGARAYADNFTEGELLDAIDYVHLYGRKLYLTVNTLLKRAEIETLPDYLLPYYEQGLDAVIVQDFGVMHVIHNYFPDLPIHISTQMSVASACGFSYLHRFGAARIVPARELSLAEIRDIRCRTDMEIECFVHGALCYCYSGQCLLSSMLGGRSGNRGRCAQPCRLPYTAFDQNRRQISGPERYLLSPKDLCTVHQIPRLIQAGINSFKIEGRMKSAEYAARVTEVYRKYIDLYLEKGITKVQKQDYQKLLLAGNRSGFTDGYLMQHNGADMITVKRPAHEKSSDPDFRLRDREKIPVHARACFRMKEPAELSVSCGGTAVCIRGGMAQKAEKQPVSQDMISMQLSKTGDTLFQMEDLTIEMDENIFLQKKDINQLRRKALEELKQQMLSVYRRTYTDNREGIFLDQTQPGSRITARKNPAFTAVIEEPDQLAAVLEHDFISRIYLDSAMYTHKDFTAQLKEHTARIKEKGRQAYLALPSVFRQETVRFYKEQWRDIMQSGIDGYLARNQDELGFLEEMQTDKKCCVLDHSLYTYSDHAKTAYVSAGWDYDTVPLELNKKELHGRDNTASELMIYGHMPLMTSAQCILKTLGRCCGNRGLSFLKDRYAKEFPVRNNCSECYNTIYNAQPLSLIQLSAELDSLQPAAYRVWFTIEAQDDVRRILQYCEEAFCRNRKPDMQKGVYTKGHYGRGVE